MLTLAVQQLLTKKLRSALTVLGQPRRLLARLFAGQRTFVDTGGVGNEIADQP